MILRYLYVLGLQEINKSSNSTLCICWINLVEVNKVHVICRIGIKQFLVWSTWL